MKLFPSCKHPVRATRQALRSLLEVFFEKTPGPEEQKDVIRMRYPGAVCVLQEQEDGREGQRVFSVRLPGGAGSRCITVRGGTIVEDLPLK
ncbi:hypothetical protein OpiT1DRAFT_01732 [Opitutaceae bacterium TAV1]|nr:hypothetical protein OpiT1DRAFT_01732 [Opitutaceae bacterium TAV1]